MQNNEFFENENTQAEEVKNSSAVGNPPENNIYTDFFKYSINTKSLQEKAEIKKASSALSGSMLCIIAFSLLYGLLFPYLLMSLGFSYEKAYGILSEPAFSQFFQIIFSLFTFTVPFIIIYKALRYRISDLITFKPPEGKNLLPIFLIGISFCSFANIAVSYAGQLFESFGINYEVDYGDNPEGFFGFMLSFFATVIVPALVEEFAFRGIALGSLRKFGDTFAVVASSVMFGMMHGNFEQMPFAFLVGLILGFVTIKTNSIIPAIIIHAFNNFISLFFNYFMNGFSTEIQNIIYTVYLPEKRFLKNLL